MNTIKLKVEAAMRKSWSAYYGYNHWLQHRSMLTKCTNGDAIYCRTVAIVQYDRVLNNAHVQPHAKRVERNEVW